MHRLFIDDRASCSPVTVDAPLLRVCRYRAVMSAGNKVVTHLETHYGVVSIAKFASAFDDRLEHRFDIGRGRRDHAEDFAAPGLVSQRLGQVAGLRLNLFKQALAITA